MFDVMSNQAKSPVLLYRRSSCIKMRQKGGSPFPVAPILNNIKDNPQHTKHKVGEDIEKKDCIGCGPFFFAFRQIS